MTKIESTNGQPFAEIDTIVPVTKMMSPSAFGMKKRSM